MKIAKEKVIPGKLDLNNVELDVVIDFKCLMARISGYMSFHDIDRAGNITREQVEDLMNDVQVFYNNVGVEYSTDNIVYKEADNG